MKLTNYIRDAFISAVLSDVPTVDYAEQARSLGNKTLAELFAKDFPGIDFKKAQESGWLDKRSIEMPGSFNSLYGHAPSYECLKSVPKVWVKLQQFSAEKKAQDNKIDALRSQLRAAAYGCTTRKALAELLPEFEKYLPPEQGPASRTLPVVQNMVADFVKAGWPKNKKEKKAA